MGSDGRRRRRKRPLELRSRSQRKKAVSRANERDSWAERRDTPPDVWAVDVEAGEWEDA